MIIFIFLQGVFKRDGGFAAPEAVAPSLPTSKGQAINSRNISQPGRSLAASVIKGGASTDDSRKVASAVTFSADAVDLKKVGVGVKTVSAVVEEEEDEEDNLMYEDGDNGGGDDDYDGYDDEYY